jgi:hypothetical protein
MAITETIPITIPDDKDGNRTGSVIVQRWTDKERTSRALRKTARIGGIALAISSLGLVIHILLLVIIPGFLIAMLSLIFIFLKTQGEKATFASAEGVCPFCKLNAAFTPFLRSELKDKITIQCSNCGQTSTAFLSSAPAEVT